MNITIKNGGTFWLAFIDSDKSQMIAGTIISREIDRFVCRIRNPHKGRDLFGGDIEEFVYPADAKEWDIMADMKKRLADLYGHIDFTDHTTDWPSSKREADRQKANRQMFEKSTREHWAEHHRRHKIKMAMMEMVRTIDA